MDEPGRPLRSIVGATLVVALQVCRYISPRLISRWNNELETMTLVVALQVCRYISPRLISRWNNELETMTLVVALQVCRYISPRLISRWNNELETIPSRSPNTNLINKTTGHFERYMSGIQPQKEKMKNSSKSLPTPASNKTQTK